MGRSLIVALGGLALTSCSSVVRPTSDSLYGGSGLGSLSTTSTGTGASSTSGLAVSSGVPRVSACETSECGVESGANAVGGSRDITGAAGIAGKAPTAVCRTPVKLGLSYSSDTAAGFAAAGASSSAIQQQANYDNNVKALYQVAVDDLNTHGGVAGCPVALAWHDFHNSGADGYDAETQAECTDFAEDQHVFAVVALNLETPLIENCLAPYHIPVFLSVSPFDAEQQSHYSTGEVYGLSQIASERLGPVIDMLYAAGYLSSSVKLGVLIADDGRGTSQNLVTHIWDPQLASLHIPVASTYTYPVLGSYGDLASEAQDMNNAVLQFRAAGVDHVLFTPGDQGTGEFLFTTAANSQGYHPRLAETSADFPGSDGAVLPPASLVGAMAVSWSIEDVWNSTSTPPEPVDAARDRCIALYKNATASAGVALPTMFPWCDVLNFLQAGLSRASGHVTAAFLQHGADMLGTSFQIADGFGPSQFGPSRYDGGTEARVIAWDSNAAAWENDSQLQVLP